MLTKILIADSCEEFRGTLSGLLQDRYAVRTCHDGIQAMNLLDSFCPDLLIVELTLQGVDGLHVMRAARKKPNNPPIVAVSPFFPEYMSHLLEEVNVVCALRKPLDMDFLLERIRDLAEDVCIPYFPAVSPFAIITNALLELGMPTGRAGFTYTREAILMLSQDPNLRVTKNIYPEIARIHNTAATAVEKDIRDVIVATWVNGNPTAHARYFLPAPNGRIPRPSNRVFLSAIAERLFNAQQCAK